MSAAVKAGRKAIRLINGIVDTAVIAAVLLLIAFGCYAMWDSKQIYQAAGAVRYETYKPAATDNEGASFDDLQALNPEVFAWLTVYGTHIDYPVVQSENNMKYINTNAEGHYSLSGGIFLDFRCNKDFSDFSSILYGHHMDKNAMFGEVGNFSDEQYFEARKYGMLYYDGLEHGLEFFAFVHTSAYNDEVFRTKITGEEARREYLDMLLSTAMHARDINVAADDRIVLLSTCSPSSTNGRDILVGRITEGIYDDTFKTDETGKTGNILSVDGLPGLWVRIPLRIKIAVTGVLFIILILLLSLMINNKKAARSKCGCNTKKRRKGDKLL
ncbi:MAG: class B sortase [Oscillospiraceae bacterium]|nr:class B sortase [Oscillospiraceae bacterium]